MRRCLVVAVALVVLAAVPACAQPAPSFLGPTGLLFVPTADVVGMAGFSAGGAVTRSDDEDVSWISANVGVLPELEIGATRVKPEHAEADTMLNAKLRLVQPPLTATTISVGMLDITDRVDRSAYAVLTHNAGMGVVLRRGLFSNPRLHLGIGGGQFDGVFGGAEITYANKVDLIAEYDSRDFNFGLRVPLAKGFQATVAGLDGFRDLGVGVALSTPW